MGPSASESWSVPSSRWKEIEDIRPRKHCHSFGLCEGLILVYALVSASCLFSRLLMRFLILVIFFISYGPWILLLGALYMCGCAHARDNNSYMVLHWLASLKGGYGCWGIKSRDGNLFLMEVWYVSAQGFSPVLRDLVKFISCFSCSWYSRIVPRSGRFRLKRSVTIC